ncbi:ComEC/Rec2 family competence protein [Vibrio sp. TBV020]|uniref:ComEC/Rec2 family competence protein n=1 Tax=Vibrio sp. TBV020 TaxID=3137398 RepID=UPI0038CD766E
MSFELRVLKAFHGDSLVIRGDFDGQFRNILIDGGPKEAFRHMRRDQELKQFLDEIKKQGQRIDLLVLTHEDGDHIQGLLSAFETDDYLACLTDEIWFNSGKLISDTLKQEFDGKGISLTRGASEYTSISEGITLEERITELGIKHDQLIASDFEGVLERFGCKFEILSPSLEHLSKRVAPWEEKYPSGYMSSEKDIRSIKDIIDSRETLQDNSKCNQISIAFNFTYKGKSVLLLGDAHAKEIAKGIRTHGYNESNKLKSEYMKLSHHGSKNNTSQELLNLVTCNKFIITTNGNRHDHPDKETLARIIKYKEKPKFYFNYPDLIENKISSQDRERYNFETEEITNVNV